MAEARDLNKIRYVVYLRHPAQPDVEYYFAGQWPDVELARLYKEGYRVSVFNEVYYTTDLALARVFDSPVRVSKTSKDLAKQEWAEKPIWDNVRALPITGEKVFKAQLKGPRKVSDPGATMELRARKMTQQFFYNKDRELFEEIE